VKGKLTSLLRSWTPKRMTNRPHPSARLLGGAGHGHWGQILSNATWPVEAAKRRERSSGRIEDRIDSGKYR
jgi:hypothetical protein